MDNKINNTVIYYIYVAFFAITTCWILMATLDWPLLAEIPLVVSLFLHILFLSKKLYEFWTKLKKKLEYNLKPIAGEFWNGNHSVFFFKEEGQDYTTPVRFPYGYYLSGRPESWRIRDFDSDGSTSVCCLVTKAGIAPIDLMCSQFSETRLISETRARSAARSKVVWDFQANLGQTLPTHSSTGSGTQRLPKTDSRFG